MGRLGSFVFRLSFARIRSIKIILPLSVLFLITSLLILIRLTFFIELRVKVIEIVFVFEVTIEEVILIVGTSTLPVIPSRILLSLLGLFIAISRGHRGFFF